MSRISVALAQILRRDALPDTQLLCRIVAHEVHGALGTSPNEADLGPARFRAGVGHRRERCGPETAARGWPDGWCSAHGGQPAPATLPSRARSRRQPQTPARAAVAARGGRGSPPAARVRHREPSTGFKLFAQPFHAAHSQILVDCVARWRARRDPSRPAGRSRRPPGGPHPARCDGRDFVRVSRPAAAGRDAAAARRATQKQH